MKKNKKGKALFFVGIWLCAFGFAFNHALGIINDIPKLLSTLSIPLLIVGIILLVTSNFYKRQSS